MNKLEEIVDLQPLPGEYVRCKETSEFTMFGVKVTAFNSIHASRVAINSKWNGKCERCNHRLRFAHIVQDENAEYHCYGFDCMNIETVGEEGAKRIRYAQRIEEKKHRSAFVVTFNVPQSFWDIPKSNRPSFARVWKFKPFRRGQLPGWKISIWSDSFEDCLSCCMELDRICGNLLSA